MPKFFVPHAKSAEEAEEVRAGVIKFVESNGFSVNDRKILRLSYTHNGRDCVAEVGVPQIPGGEPVLVILDAGDLYLVCTPNRGVLGGLPILVGKHDVYCVDDFE